MTAESLFACELFMTSNTHSSLTEDLLRQAYDFVTRHPDHPLAENLRIKARLLNACSSEPISGLELRVLLNTARMLLAPSTPLALNPPLLPDKD